MDVLQIIENTKIIAIARGVYGLELETAALALYDGGIRAFEVTFEQDSCDGATEGSIARTCEQIARLCEILPRNAVVGAGTVMTPLQAEKAHNAGARFIISPNVDTEVIAKTKLLGMVSIPGAMTPTEICLAHSAGADIVKLFPAGVLGVEYFKAVKAPLSNVKLAAVAGITVKNIGEFARAGAAAFGISSGLFIASAVENGDHTLLQSTAQAFIQALDS